MIALAELSKTNKTGQSKSQELEPKTFETKLALLFSSSFENDREILACDGLFWEIWRLKFEIQSEQFSTHLNASIRWSRYTEYVTGVEQQKNLKNGWQ